MAADLAPSSPPIRQSKLNSFAPPFNVSPPIGAEIEPHRRPKRARKTSQKVQENAEAWVDCRVAILWPDDNAWYEGIVQEFDAETGKHFIIYDDGGTEWIELAKESVKLIKEDERVSSSTSEEFGIPAAKRRKGSELRRKERFEAKYDPVARESDRPDELETGAEELETGVDELEAGAVELATGAVERSQSRVEPSGGGTVASDVGKSEVEADVSREKVDSRRSALKLTPPRRRDPSRRSATPQRLTEDFRFDLLDQAEERERAANKVKRQNRQFSLAREKETVMRASWLNELGKRKRSLVDENVGRESGRRTRRRMHSPRNDSVQWPKPPAGVALSVRDSRRYTVATGVAVRDEMSHNRRKRRGHDWSGRTRNSPVKSPSRHVALDRPHKSPSRQVALERSHKTQRSPRSGRRKAEKGSTDEQIRDALLSFLRPTPLMRKCLERRARKSVPKRLHPDDDVNISMRKSTLVSPGNLPSLRRSRRKHVTSRYSRSGMMLFSDRFRRSLTGFRQATASYIRACFTDERAWRAHIPCKNPLFSSAAWPKQEEEKEEKEYVVVEDEESDAEKSMVELSSDLTVGSVASKSGRSSRSTSPSGSATFQPTGVITNKGDDIVLEKLIDHHWVDPPPSVRYIRSHSFLNVYDIDQRYKYKCYCGRGEAPQTATMVKCNKCYNWLHADCVAKAPNDLLPGDRCYKFRCRRCSKTGNERFERTSVTWSEAARLAIYNLVVRSRTETRPLFFGLRDDIVSFVMSNWDSLRPGEMKKDSGRKEPSKSPSSPSKSREPSPVASQLSTLCDVSASVIRRKSAEVEATRNRNPKSVTDFGFLTTKMIQDQKIFRRSATGLWSLQPPEIQSIKNFHVSLSKSGRKLKSGSTASGRFSTSAEFVPIVPVLSEELTLKTFSDSKYSGFSSLNLSKSFKKQPIWIQNNQTGFENLGIPLLKSVSPLNVLNRPPLQVLPRGGVSRGRATARAGYRGMMRGRGSTFVPGRGQPMTRGRGQLMARGRGQPMARGRGSQNWQHRGQSIRGLVRPVVVGRGLSKPFMRGGSVSNMRGGPVSRGLNNVPRGSKHVFRGGQLHHRGGYTNGLSYVSKAPYNYQMPPAAQPHHSSAVGQHNMMSTGPNMRVQPGPLQQSSINSIPLHQQMLFNRRPPVLLPKPPPPLGPSQQHLVPPLNVPPPNYQLISTQPSILTGPAISNAQQTSLAQ
eukprot:805797_1